MPTFWMFALLIVLQSYYLYPEMWKFWKQYLLLFVRKASTKKAR